MSNRSDNSEPGFIFRPEDAWFDRIQLAIRIPVHTSPGRLHKALEGIAEKQWGVSYKSYPDAQLEFNARQFLFGGTLSFSSKLGSGRIEATATLHLNPLRFAAHKHRRLVGDVTHASPRDLLRFSPRAHVEVRPQTILHQDNFLTDEIASPITARRDEILGVYMRAIRSYLFEILDEISPSSDQLQRSLEWTVQQAEICWDFADANAIEKAEAVGRALMQVEPRSSRQSYPTDRGEVVSSTMVPLMNNENPRMSVYAKSPARVRAEVRYSGSIGQRYGSKDYTKFNNKKFDAIAPFLIALSTHAAKRASTIMSSIKLVGEETGTSPCTKTVGQALVDLFGCLADQPGAAEYVLRGITRRKAIFGTKTTHGEAFECLVDAGIFVRVRRRVRERSMLVFAPTPQYSVAFEQIRQAAIAPIPGPHENEEPADD